MRQEVIDAEQFVLCTSADGWSLHAPGSLDGEIASGDAPYLVSGAGKPMDRDYLAAATALCPWAAIVVSVEGGFMAFESMQDFKTWERQV